MATMSRKFFYLLAVLFIFSAIASQAYGNGETVFGPEDFKIRRWHVHLSFHRFRVDDPGAGVIVITKNTPNKKIRGGFLLVNRRFIPIRSFLVGSDTVFEKEISLRSRNRMTVFLRGTPGASISIEVRKKSAILPPEVSFSADPQSISLGNSSTLTWTTTNAESVSIDQGIGPVDQHGTLNVSPQESTTYTITAMGPGGRATASVTVTVVSPITLTITSPLDGDTISGPDIMVEGTISNTEGNETGVTVNRIVASVNGDHFVANHVSLQEGESTIIAAATDTDGNTAKASITVYPDTTSDYIRITTDTESGISPLETTLRVEGSFSFTDSSLTDIGPGVVEVLENPTPEEYRVRMTTEGIYYFTARVDYQDKTCTDTIAIIVLYQAELDAMLRAKWEGMKTSLINNNIEGALNYFHESSKQDYQEIFNLLRARLPHIVSAMREIELIYSEDRLAKYRIKREEMVQGQTYDITYYIYFIRDFNGLWRIDTF